MGADPATALIAPDSFKGTLDATAVAAALGAGFEAAAWAHDAGSVAALERAGREIADLYSVRGR